MAEGGGPKSPPSFNEPEARYFSSAAAVGDLVFMYRGYLKSYQNKPRSVSPPSRCEVFNTKVLKWDKRYTQGPNPKAWQSSSVAVFQHRLFYYGGWSGRDYTNELFELDTLVVPMKWMQHEPENPKEGPRKKEGCGFVSLPGGEELCLFAGYGIPFGPDPPGTRILLDERYEDGRGWTNELHCYHLRKAKWRSPEQTGQRPEPGVAMTFTRVDAIRIVVFAGYNRNEMRRTNEVHILDISDVSIWHWSGVILPQVLKWPEGRCYHTAYSLWDPDSDPQSPSLVVTCGWSEDAVPLGDLWVFQVIGLNWEELELPDSIVPRLKHTGGLVHVSSTKRLLVTNGGIPEDTNQYDSLKDYPIISETVVTELDYDEAAAAEGSCGWSVASVVKNDSKVTRGAAAVKKTEEKAPTYLDRKLEEEFELKDRLGSGGFGVVYRVKNKYDDGEFALKIIKLPAHKNQKKKVEAEVLALRQLDHNRIMRYFQSWPARVLNQTILDSFEERNDPFACAEFSSYGLPVAGDSPTVVATDKEEDEEGDEESGSKFPWCLFIQIQLCRRDTLKDWLLSNIDDRPRERVFQYFEQILEAVVYIHRRGLLHRDLKPSNIFFSQEDGGIKVGDFGLVAGNTSSETSLQMQSHSGQVGTWFYMAPEQLTLGMKYDQKVDIFALGVIFFEMNYPMTAEKRIQVLTTLRQKYTLPVKFTKKFPLEADFVRKLLKLKPGRRPSATTVSENLKTLRAKLGTLPAPHVRDSSSVPSSVEGGVPAETLQNKGAERDITDSGMAGDSQTHSELRQPKFSGGHSTDSGYGSRTHSELHHPDPVREVEPPRKQPRRQQATDHPDTPVPGVITSTSERHQETPQERNTTKRKTSEGDVGGTKRRVELKKGEITDGERFLLDIAREIGVKWLEVGVSLGIEVNILTSVVGSKPVEDHMKAFHMLLEWRNRVPDGFTYGNLASALEAAGLVKCARDHCYADN